jgi:hypothetical protein
MSSSRWCRRGDAVALDEVATGVPTFGAVQIPPDMPRAVLLGGLSEKEVAVNGEYFPAIRYERRSMAAVLCRAKYIPTFSS